MRKLVCVLTMLLFSIALVVGVAAEGEISTDTVEIVEPTVSYTADSVIKTGVLYSIDEFSINKVEKTYSITLAKDFEIGYTVYDDPDTDIVDGIRVNGNTVNSFRIDGLKFNEPCEIVVRTVYTDGVGGMLAQMHDGVYDYTKLLSNPVALVQIIYYIILCVSAIAGILYAARSRKAKVKTANEIAYAVDARAQSAQDMLKQYVSDLFKDSVIPALQNIQNLNQNAVKAVALSTSKSKEAPLALLELLNDPANTDMSTLVETLKTKVVESQTAQEEAKQHTLDALTAIAKTTQEVKANEPKTTAEEAAIF